MADIRDLIPKAQRRPQVIAGMWYAQFTQPAPLTEADPAYTIIPDIDVDTKWGPCIWSPRVEQDGAVVVRVLPVVGSIALVLFDNRQNIWVVEWH